jgi:hypothetical protein
VVEDMRGKGTFREYKIATVAGRGRAQQNRNDLESFRAIITPRITTWVSKAGKFPAAAEPN